jgi:hypothetical protein
MFNRDGLIMEVPGRIWSARLGAGSCTVHAPRCAGVPFRSLNFLDSAEKDFSVRCVIQWAPDPPQDQSNSDLQTGQVR